MEGNRQLMLSFNWTERVDCRLNLVWAGGGGKCWQGVEEGRVGKDGASK